MAKIKNKAQTKTPVRVGTGASDYARRLLELSAQRQAQQAQAQTQTTTQRPRRQYTSQAARAALPISTPAQEPQNKWADALENYRSILARRAAETAQRQATTQTAAQTVNPTHTHRYGIINSAPTAPASKAQAQQNLQIIAENNRNQGGAPLPSVTANSNAYFQRIREVMGKAQSHLQNYPEVFKRSSNKEHYQPDRPESMTYPQMRNYYNTYTTGTDNDAHQYDPTKPLDYTYNDGTTNQYWLEKGLFVNGFPAMKEAMDRGGVQYNPMEMMARYGKGEKDRAQGVTSQYLTGQKEQYDKAAETAKSDFIALLQSHYNDINPEDRYIIDNAVNDLTNGNFGTHAGNIVNARSWSLAGLSDEEGEQLKNLYNDYLKSATTSASMNRAIQDSEIWEKPGEIVKQVLESPDYGTYEPLSKDAYYQYYDTHGMGPDANPKAVEVLQQISEWQNYGDPTMGNVGADYDTKGSARIANANAYEDQRDEEARRIAKQYGLKVSDDDTIDEIARTAIGLFRYDISSELDKIKEKYRPAIEGERKGTDVRSNYIEDDELKAMTALASKAWSLDESGDTAGASQAWDEAYNLLKALEAKWNQEYTYASQQDYERFAEKNPVLAFGQDRLLTAAGAALAPMQTALYKNVGNKAMYYGLFNPNYRKSVQEGVIQADLNNWANTQFAGFNESGIAKKLGITAGDVAGFIYGGIQNGIDQIMRDLPGYIVPGMSTFSLLTMAAGVYSDQLFDGMERGSEEADNMEKAVVSALTEYFSEKLPSDFATKWINDKGFMRRWVKMAIPEMMEEYFSGSVNLAYDKNAGDYTADIFQDWLDLVNDGMDPDKAMDEVERKNRNETLTDALSAGVFSFGNAAVGALSNRQNEQMDRLYNMAALNQQSGEQILKARNEAKDIEAKQNQAREAMNNAETEEAKAQAQQEIEALEEQKNEVLSSIAAVEKVHDRRAEKITKMTHKLTGLDIPAQKSEDIGKARRRQESEVKKGDLGDGKTINGLTKEGNIIASDGTEIEAKDVDFEAMPETKALYDEAMRMKEDYGISPALVYGGFAEGEKLTKYIDAVEAITYGASSGTALGNIIKANQTAALIPTSIASEVYKQATVNRETLTEAAKAKLQRLSKLTGNGTVRLTKEASDLLANEKEGSDLLNEVSLVRDIFGNRGVTIEFFASKADEKGVYTNREQGSTNAEGDLVRIDLNAGKTKEGDAVKSAVLQVAAHEFTHVIATRNPDGLNQLAKLASDYMTAKGGSIAQFAELARAKNKDANKGKGISASLALEEAVAEASEMVWGDPDFAKYTAQRSPSIARNIRDWLRGITRRISQAFKGATRLTRTSASIEGIMSEYAKTWNKALASALHENWSEKGLKETVKGNEGTAYTSDNQAVKYHYEVVSPFDLTASNDYQDLKVNPEYPADLQPRDRSRQTSEDQIDGIVRNLNPGRLMDSSEASTGAPIVGPDYIVESGNGRTIALQRVMSQGGENARKYTEALRQQAEKFGINPDDIPDGAVLVRVRDNELSASERVDFARASNVSSVMQSGATETADSDADRISSKTLGIYNPGGTVSSNTDFYLSFLNEAVPESERNAMLTSKGQPSQSLITRAENALFQRAYGDTELTEHMSERADPEAKNAVQALMNVAARVADISDRIKSGQLQNIDFSGDIAEAASQFAELKRTGESVKDWLDQESMFDQDETVRSIVGLMEEYKMSSKKLTGVLNSMLDQVEIAGNPNQESLFGESDLPTKDDIIRRAKSMEGETRRSAREGEVETSRDADGDEVFYDDTATTRYSKRVTDPAELEMLNSGKTITTYKTMKLLNGKLYPPKATAAGRGVMEDYSVLGQWEKAVEHPEWIKVKDGKPTFDLVENGSKTTNARYNPYMHSSNLMINDQFSGAYQYGDEESNLGRFVTVECEVPASEETSGYHAQYAKDGTGWHSWHAGTVAGALHNGKGIERQVFLSRWIKPVRIVPDSEVAAHYAELISGTNIKVPDNVVPPSLFQALREANVPIKVTGKVDAGDVRRSTRASDADYMAAVENGDTEAAQRMVDEAARAAGYNTTKLYHGTGAFGFTKFDLNLGEQLIFATSSRDLAQTYSGETARSRISERVTKDPDVLHGEELISEAKKVLPKYNGYKLATKAERKQYIEDSRNRIDRIIQQVNNFVSENDGAFDRQKSDIINGMIGALQDLAAAVNTDEVSEAWDKYENATWDLKWMDESIQMEIAKYAGRELMAAKNTLDDFLYDGDLYVQSKGLTDAYVFDNQLQAELGAEWGKGVYELYGKPGKQLVIEANGENWNSIKPPEELSTLFGPQRTRDIAAAAKAADYSSVRIKDLRDSGGGTDYNRPSDVYIFLKPNQVKSSDPVVYDDSGNVIPLSERFNPENEDIRYSVRSDAELTDREILGEALPEIAKTKGEELYLTQYQQAYNDLRNYTRELNDQREIMAENKDYSIREQTESDEPDARVNNGNFRAKYMEAQNRAEIYERHVNEARAKLEELEKDNRFKDMVGREVRRAESAVRRDIESGTTREQDYEKTINRYQRRAYNARRALNQYREDRRERTDNSRRIERIQDTAKSLMDMINTNSDKKHVPEALKEPLGDFLTSLNLFSKRANAGGEMTQADLKLSQYLRRVQDVLARSESLNDQGDYTGELYLPDGFADQIANIARALEVHEEAFKDANPIVHMNAQSLVTLDNVLRALRKAINDANRTYTNASYERISDMGRKTITYLNGYNAASKRQPGAKKYVQWDMATPVYAMDRFGDVGKSLFKALRDGYGRRAMRLNEVEEYAAANWKSAEAKKWHDHINEFSFEREGEGGKTYNVEVKLTDSQIMNLYLVMKRDQGRQHAMTGGIRAQTVETNSGTVLINQPEAAHLTEAEIQEITDSLTDRQREVADAMGAYMKTTSKWGNEVTMARWDIKQLGEANYWPIATDEFSRAGVSEDMSRGNNLYRLLNMSFMKELNPHANNALVLGDVFDIFAAHTTDMATFSTMALPALDMIRWYNYRQKLDDGTMISTRGAMSRTYGSSADEYIRNLISDFSGATKSVERGQISRIYSKLMSHGKRAAVANNLSVVLKQPGSILRAGYILPRAMYLRPTAVISRKTYNEMIEHSGIARWKSMGYFDTNLAKPMQEKIAGGNNYMDKALEWMTKGAEWMDKNTMVSIWLASKAQVKHDNPNMDTESEEFFAKVTDLFEEVIYRTQVVDSTLTRSQAMRDPGYLGKAVNAFMAEPTLSYNVMMDAIASAWREHRQGRKAITKATGGRLAMAALTLTASKLVEAIVSSMMGAWRDDDDFKTLMEKFYDLLGGNILDSMNPIGDIPLFSFLLDYIKGDGSTIADSGLTQLYYALNGMKKIVWKDGKFNKDWESDLGNNWQKLTRYTSSAASYLSGLPIYNTLREGWNAWNNLMDATGNYELKFHPYSSTDSDKSRAQMMFDAVREGDEAKVKRYQSVMKANGLVGDKFTTAWTTVCREQFQAGVPEEEIEKMLIQYGGYAETGTKSAYYKIQEWKWKMEAGEHEGNFGIKAKATEALAIGDSASIGYAYRELIDKYGKTEKEARSTMGECITDLLKDGDITPQEAEVLYREWTDRTDKSIQTTLKKYQ